MHGIAVETRKGPVTVRPLRNGDAETVRAVFDQLGPDSRRLRFGTTAQPASHELGVLARVDGRRHVLVAHGAGRPIGVAHLARDAADRTVAEVAIAVADDWQSVGVGSELLRLLTMDAAAAGILHIRAVMKLENRRSLSLLRRTTRIVSRRIEAGELHLVAATS